MGNQDDGAYLVFRRTGARGGDYAVALEPSLSPSSSEPVSGAELH